jgi:hypothetical protein
MSRRIALLAALVAVVALSAAAVAFAGSGGAGTTTFTQHATNVVFIPPSPSADPCNPSDTGTLSATSANEVFHITTQADGTFWVTGTDEGTVTFTADNPADASASGHFASWFGESLNGPNSDVQHDTSTFNLQATDGSHIVVHGRDHLTVNANGVVTATFSVQSVTCG